MAYGSQVGNRVNIWGKGGLFEQRLGQKSLLDDREADREDLLAQSLGQFREDTGTAALMGKETERTELMDGQYEDLDFDGLSALSKSRGMRDILDSSGKLMGLRGSRVGGSGGAGYTPGSSLVTTLRGTGKGTRPKGDSLAFGEKDDSSFSGLRAGYQNGGQVQPAWDVDPRSPEEIMAQEVAQQALASQERGGQMHRPQQPSLRAPGYKWGTQPQPAQSEAPAPGGYKWGREPGLRRGGKVPCFDQGGAVHPGMTKTGKIRMPEMSEEPGPIGDPAMDTGEDTVDAKVRPGEVLINPPTVEYLGGGDYDEGLRVLNEATMEATGEPMGAEYEDGKLNAQDGLVVPESQKVRDARARIAKAEAAKLERRMGMDPTKRRTISPEGQAELNKPSSTTKPAQMKPTPGATAQELKDATRANRFYKTGSGAGKVARGVRNIVSPAAVGGGIGLAGLAEGWDRFDLDPNNDETLGGMAEQFQEGNYQGIGLGAIEGAANAGMDLISGTATVADTVLPYLPGIDETNLEGGFADAMQELYPNADIGRSDGTGMRAPPRLPGGVSPDEYAEGLWNPYSDALTPQYQEETLTNPQGEEFTTTPPTENYDPAQGPLAGPVQSEEEMVANYLARSSQNADTFGKNPVNAGDLRQIPGTNTQYAGNYGGQDVTVTEGKFGEPVFTGLRSPEEVAASTARSNAPPPPPKTNEQRNQEEYDKLAALPRKTPTQRRQMSVLSTQLARADEARELSATRRATARATRKNDVDKRISARFQRKHVAEDGKVTYAPDQEKETVFRDAMSKLGVDPYSMTEAEQDRFMEQFEPVYNDQMLAMQAARQQDLPVSDVPRTGRNALKVIPNSNIGIGDVLGGGATTGDYWAGFWPNSDPYNDRMVEDPVSRARTSLRRAAQAPGGGRDLDAMERFGYFEGQ